MKEAAGAIRNVGEEKLRSQHFIFFHSLNNSSRPPFSIFCTGNASFYSSFRRHNRITLPVFLHRRRRCRIGAVCHSQYTQAESESSYTSLLYTSAQIIAFSANRAEPKLCKAAQLFSCYLYLLPWYHSFLDDNEVGAVESDENNSYQ